MSIQFENAAEAMAAVTSVVMSADGVSSAEEQQFLFERIQRLEVFKAYDEQAFKRLMGDVVGRMYGCLPVNDFGLTADGVKTMLQCACGVLDGDQRRECFEVAAALMFSDGLAEEERALLEQLRQGLEVDETTAHQVMAEHEASGQA